MWEMLYAQESFLILLKVKYLVGKCLVTREESKYHILSLGLYVLYIVQNIAHVQGTLMDLIKGTNMSEAWFLPP